MPRASHLQPAFNQGEWSPVTYGRADIELRGKALSLCRWFLPLVQGPVTRTPGTWFVAPAKTLAVRLQRFAFNTAQAYVLEFGNSSIRFYTQGGQLLSGGVPYEVATPYGDADLPGLYFTQSADVLYIAHPNFPLKKLSRLGATNWTLADAVFQDGPYLPQNTDDNYASCTATRVGASGTLTFANTSNINGGAGLSASDVGRLVRITNTHWDGTSTTDPSKWIQLKITAVTNTKTATVTVVGVVPQ